MQTNSRDARIAVLVSGQGGVLRGLIAAQGKGELGGSIACVLSDRECGAIELAQHHGIAARVFSFAKRIERDAAMLECLRSMNVELVALAGYFKILSPLFVEAYPERILNTHPSLLPAFAGLMDLDVYVAVLASGVKYTGVTAHLVTTDVDAGRIIDQAVVRVEETDTPETLRARVKAVEAEFFPRVVAQYLKNLKS